MSVKSVSMQRVFVALVACVLLAAAALTAVAVMPSQAFATKSEPYEYTIRVFGGNESSYYFEGTFNEGDSFTLDKSAITPSDDKYYVKGFRISGQDELAKESFTVNADMDFVVAYGVKGEMVSYTINFVEYGTGNAVANDQGATSVTYEGKQGDKPVVPYEYVPGYRPRYLNITGTLGPEGTNNWTLEYIPLTVEEIVETTTEGGTAAGGAAAGGTAAGGTAGGAATPPATEEIVDVDNPLASGSDKKDTKLDTTGSADAGIPIAPIVGGVAGLAVIAGIAAAIASRKKGQQK